VSRKGAQRGLEKKNPKGVVWLQERNQIKQGKEGLHSGGACSFWGMRERVKGIQGANPTVSLREKKPREREELQANNRSEKVKKPIWTREEKERRKKGWGKIGDGAANSKKD